MKSLSRAIVFSAAGFFAAALTGQALQAATVNWTFNQSTCISTDPGGNCGAGHSNWAQSKTFKGDDDSPVKVTGWANTSPGGQNTTLAQGEVTHWNGSGLGVKHADAAFDGGEGSSPEHAIDNDGRVELVVLSFNEKAVLNSLEIGWYSQDADVSILAYVGLNDPFDSTSSDYLGVQQAYLGNETLTDNGWVHIGNYDIDNGGTSIGSGDYRLSFNSSDVAATDWIVSSYNTAFGTACNPTNYCQQDYADYFKLSGVSGTFVPFDPPTPVPLPATAWLLLAGIGGLGAMRRFRRG